MTDFHYEKVGSRGDIVAVVLAGNLDEVACGYLLECVESQIEDGCEKLILDCTDLDFVSSMGLGMLMRVHSKMKRLGGDVRLAGLKGSVANVVRIVQLDRVLKMYPSVKDAVAAYEA